MKFNKIKLITGLFLALGVSAFGQNNVGTLVTDPVRPFSVSSTHPSAIANEIKGGPFSSSNLVGLSNIPAPRLELGAIGYATNTGLYYRLTATNPATWSSINGANITNIAASNVVGAITGTVGLASNVTGTIAISNGGSGATTADGARTNLGLGATNNIVFNSLHAEQDASSGIYTLSIGQTNTGFRGVGGGPNDFVFARNGTNVLGLTSGNIQSFVGHSFSAPLTLNYGAGSTSVISFAGIDSAIGAAISRTNLGLGATWLTNTNNPVFVNTNGDVVSPTNFWQRAPIQTVVQDFTGITVNQTNNATNARNVYVYSLATNVSGISNTIILPTNTLTFNGDDVTVVHKGIANTTTVVRQAGATNNLITLNKFDESVKFIRELGQWDFYHNISFVEPIQFSGTNAAANVAASRTNLGLGVNQIVEFGELIIGGSLFAVDPVEAAFAVPIVFSGTNSSVNASTSRTNLGLGATWLTNTNVTNFRTAIGLGATNQVTFGSLITTIIEIANTGSLQADGTATFAGGWIFDQAPQFTLAAATRTNLGIGATNIVTFAGLTNNGDITINQTATNNGLLYIRRTNVEPFLGLANLIASNNTTVSNETLFRVGVAEATNKSAQFGFRSTNTNGNGVAVFSVFGYNALMMIGPSDPAAGTNPIQATISSINPTNRVMTLITTNTGAMQMHRPIEWDNTTNSAVTRTNLGLGHGITTNLDIKLNDNSGMRLYFSNGILTNAVTPIP